jgi:hypothetical protein
LSMSIYVTAPPKRHCETQIYNHTTQSQILSQTTLDTSQTSFVCNYAK